MSPSGAHTPGTPWALMAEFESPGQLVAATRKVTEMGYRQIDCHTPFPIHELDEAMGIRPTILPWFVFCGGLAGFLTALAIQSWMNGIDYPYLISNKPLFSWPASIPVAFELTILFSALSAFLGMLILNSLPAHYHPAFKVHQFERATTDRFFLVIKSTDTNFVPEHTRNLLDSLNPSLIIELED